MREDLLMNIRRNNVPNFEWNGPPIPDVKPLFAWIAEGTDGTIWVGRYTAARERPITDPDVLRTASAKTEWVSTMAADVFDANGRFLGAVRFPSNFAGYPPSPVPTPVFNGERLWGVAMHADGYAQVVRYRVQR
jgi:hypothetical protein